MSVDTRWNESQCWDVVANDGWAWLRTIGVPVDYSGFAKLRDIVPYSDKALARKVRPMLHLSREYNEGVKNPLHAKTNKQPVYPAWCQGTRQSPCLPFESGPDTLPGMERMVG